MCIRDRDWPGQEIHPAWLPSPRPSPEQRVRRRSRQTMNRPCLLYTSDAADERSSVDLGGRRIIKKKNDRRHIEIRMITQKKHNESNSPVQTATRESKNDTR